MPTKPNLIVTVGCDPEVFLKRDSQAGTRTLISAHDLIPGTKDKPHKVTNGAVQVDGVAAEINIEPASAGEIFALRVESVLKQLQDMVPNHPIKIQAAYTFPQEYFNSLPLNVIELGCNPDFNAWTGVMNPIPNGMATTLRTAAGHIHVGWTKNKDIQDPTHFEDCCRLVKQLDYSLGLATLLWDQDNRRRTLYGKAGAFRPKPYGLEYRTPSNMWLLHPKLWRWIPYAVIKTVQDLVNGATYLPDMYGNKAQTIIDSGDIEFVKSSEYRQMLNVMDLEKPSW